MTSMQQTDPWQELTGLCDPLVLRAPKTWGDPLRSAHMEMPQNLEGAIRYIQNNLIGCLWVDHLVLLTGVLYSQNLQYRTVLASLSTLHCGLRVIFAELQLQSMSDWNVDKHLPLYLSGQIVAAHTAQQRLAFWRVYQAGSRHLKRWLTNLPPEEQARYAPDVFPFPDDQEELARLSGWKHVISERQEKRKADTDAIMPFSGELRAQAHLRYNMLMRLRKAYRRAIQMVEQGKAVLPFEFEMREGGRDRKGQPATERLIFRVWNRRTFVQHHPSSFSRSVHWYVERKRRSYTDQKNTYLLEFVRVEALSGESPPTGLWFLELLEHDVVGATTYGPDSVVASRRAWLRAQGYGEDDRNELTDPFEAQTAGVLHPSNSESARFMKKARTATSALFIPVESFCVAATFGMVALQILTANGMRIGELQQLRASADCIIPIVLPSAPEAQDQSPTVHWAVRAIPKGHRTAATYYLDEEHLRLLSLVKLMLCEQYGIDPKAGGDLPLVALKGNNKHRFPPDRYLFQYSHRGLPEDDIRAGIRFLVHGLAFQTLEGRRVIIRPHLLRHGFATWALNVAKEPIDIVAAILNQKNLDVTKYYGRPNPRALAERTHGLMNQISNSIDVDDLILRSPEELREQLKKAQQTHGTLARVRGGRCLLSGECPLFFACIGCSAKIPDPTQRGELEEFQHVTLLQIERARKRGLTLEVLQSQKKLKQCEAELKEMKMIEAYREDESREPEVNFEIDA